MALAQLPERREEIVTAITYSACSKSRSQAPGAGQEVCPASGLESMASRSPSPSSSPSSTKSAPPTLIIKGALSSGAAPPSSVSGRSQLESAAISHLYIVHTLFQALTRSALLCYHDTNIALEFLQAV